MLFIFYRCVSIFEVVEPLKTFYTAYIIFLKAFLIMPKILVPVLSCFVQNLVHSHCSVLSDVMDMTQARRFYCDDCIRVSGSSEVSLIEDMEHVQTS
jgi:hypothetical protein